MTTHVSLLPQNSCNPTPPGSKHRRRELVSCERGWAKTISGKRCQARQAQHTKAWLGGRRWKRAWISSALFSEEEKHSWLHRRHQQSGTLFFNQPGNASLGQVLRATDSTVPRPMAGGAAPSPTADGRGSPAWAPSVVSVFSQIEILTMPPPHLGKSNPDFLQTRGHRHLGVKEEMKTELTVGVTGPQE